MEGRIVILDAIFVVKGIEQVCFTHKHQRCQQEEEFGTWLSMRKLEEMVWHFTQIGDWQDANS